MNTVPESAATLQPLLKIAELFEKRLPEGQRWLESFQRALEDAHARNANLTRVFSRFALWCLTECKYNALCCAYNREDVAIVQWAAWQHKLLEPELNDRDFAHCLQKMQGYGAAAVFLLSRRAAAVATAFASVVALRDPAYAPEMVSYASVMHYASIWLSDLPDTGMQELSDKLLELVTGA